MSRLRRNAGLLACVSLLVPTDSSWARRNSSTLRLRKMGGADCGLLLSLVSESWSEWLNDPRFQEEAKRVQAEQASAKMRNRR
jgi:hypothetical protein